jgi:hypothetical protein
VKKPKQRVITHQIVLAQMAPGTRYSVHEIAKLVGTSAPTVRRALADGVMRGNLRRRIEGKRDLYWLPTADGLASDEGRQRTIPLGTLQGYDAAHRRFRELCMVSRETREGDRNGKSDGSQHD